MRQSDLEKYAEEVQRFPRRRLYFFIIFVLTLLSPIVISFQSDDATALPWKISATVQITSITIIFLFLAWLPLLIPWLISMSPRLQKLLMGLRESGIEEIEAGILRIKLSPGIKEAAENYEQKVVDAKIDPDKLENIYKEAIASLGKSKSLPSTDAITRINEVCSYYDRIRQTLPSGSRRTKLMTELSSILWPLMSRAKIDDLNIGTRLNSPSGGQRLSAYKYLEYEPNMEHANLLLSRGAGILEEPFGQYGALLAIRRMVVNLQLTDSQKKLMVTLLQWASELQYMGSDRKYLMRSIVATLEKNS